MSNEFNEQLNAAPEPEMRESAPIAPKEAAPAAAAYEPPAQNMQEDAVNNADDTPSPVVRLVDNQNFKTFSYGDDDHAPGMQKGAKHEDQAQEAINAIRKDITLIAVGSTQRNANQNLVSRQAGNDDMYKSVRGQQELARQMAEQQRIAAWNNTQIMVGGVRMTNAQAQEARRNVIENDERYADWAVEKGYIRADQKDEFKKAAREMYELKEEEKRKGKLTEEQQRRFDELQRSAVGQAVDRATADSYTQQQAINAKREARAESVAPVRQEIADQIKIKDQDKSQDSLIDKATADAYLKDRSSTPITTNGPEEQKAAGVSVASMVSKSSISRDVDLNGDFTNAVAGTTAVQQPVASADIKAKPAALGLG